MVDLLLLLNWVGAVLLLALAWLILAGTASGTVAALMWAFRLGTLLWVPTPNGQRPIDRRAVSEAGSRLVDQAEQVAAIAASRAAVPHTLHYHVSGGPAGARLAEPVTEPPRPAVQVPTFAALLDQGDIGPNQPLVFGVAADDGRLLRGSMGRLYSAGVGGLQGSGKTWTVAFLAASIVLTGGRLLVIDPHGADDPADADPESLTARIWPLAPAFLAPIATTEAAMSRVISLADAIIDRRKAGDRDRTPVVLIVDEWTALMRGDLREPLTRFMARVTQEGRKFGVVGLLLAQRWAGDDAGGNAIRNTLTAAYVHRMRPSEARMLTGLTARQVPTDTPQLPPGHAYLMDTAGTMTRVVIPPMTGRDIERVGALVSSGPRWGDALGQGGDTADQPTVRPPFGWSVRSDTPERSNGLERWDHSTVRSDGENPPNGAFETILVPNERPNDGGELVSPEHQTLIRQAVEARLPKQLSLQQLFDVRPGDNARWRRYSAAWDAMRERREEHS